LFNPYLKTIEISFHPAECRPSRLC